MANSTPTGRGNRVVLRPESHQALKQGIEQIVAAVRPTLGPRPRHVAVESPSGRNSVPELLDDGATIARRVIALGDKDADMGAMLVRHLLWRQTDIYGDGAATAAVLFETIYSEGLRYIASGGNTMVLRRHLERGMHIILDHLSDMAVPVRGKDRLGRLAKTVCYDDEIALLMGEIFDVIGEHGYLNIRLGQGRRHEREYVEGVYWEEGLLSRSLLPEGTPMIEIENAALLLTDMDLKEPRDLVPALEMARESDSDGLVVTARSVSDSIIGLLVANSDPGQFRAIAVKTPTTEVTLQAETMLDLAILTGGRPLLRDAGDSLQSVSQADFGHGRRVWADMHRFGIVGAQGDPRVLRRRVSDLRRALSDEENTEKHDRLRQRMGRLMGGTAILHVGGMHETEMRVRKEIAERTALVLRSAMREGVIPGGGAGLLACQEALRNAWDEEPDVDQRAAFRILNRALEAPIRTIIANAGCDVSEAIYNLHHSEPGWGFDVNTEQVTSMLEAGIVDSVAIQRAVVANAIKTAALALTVDVLVHHKTLDQQLRP